MVLMKRVLAGVGFIALTLFCVRAVFAQSGNQTLGPINSESINYEQFVGVGNWTTVQLALTKACAINAGYGRVVIQQGASPADGPTIGGVSSYTINGCANVTIVDQRGTAGTSCYVYSNSTTYAQGTCSAGGGTTTAALTMNNSGSGAASGTTFNGGTAQTLSYNTLGAAGLAVSNTFNVANPQTMGPLSIFSTASRDSLVLTPLSGTTYLDFKGPNTSTVESVALRNYSSDESLGGGFLNIGTDQGISTPGVTGGDEGSHTLNAAGLYVNGAAVSTSGFTNPMTTLGDVIYGGASGAATRLAGPTTTAHTFVLSDIPVSSAAVAPVWTDLATYLGSPPAFGLTAPNAGKFTTITGGTNIGSNVNYINMQCQSAFAGIDMIFPGGDCSTSNSGDGIDVFRSASVAVVGAAKDIFMQGIPAAGGYFVLESADAAGIAVETQGSKPILFRPNRTTLGEIFPSGGMMLNTSPTDPGAGTFSTPHLVGSTDFKLAGGTAATSTSGGANLTTGPGSGTTAGHIATFSNTSGNLQDSSVALTAIPAADIATGALANGMTATTQSPGDNSTKLATTAYADAAGGAVATRQNWYWNVQPVLFSTVTMLSTVWESFITTTSSNYRVTARLSGAISCTSAPTVDVMDLGTDPTTAYGDATILFSTGTGTSDGVYNGISDPITLTAGHFYGIGFADGTCVTPPTFDIAMIVE